MRTPLNRMYRKEHKELGNGATVRVSRDPYPGSTSSVSRSATDRGEMSWRGGAATNGRMRPAGVGARAGGCPRDGPRETAVGACH